MKYSFQASEAEMLGFYRAVENVAVEVLHTIRANGPKAPAPVEAPPEVPAPVEAPPEVPAPTMPEMSAKDKKRIEKGRALLGALVGEWAANFGVEGVEQPDRGSALRNVASGPEAGAVLAYTSFMGGLTRAVDGVIPPAHWTGLEEARRKLVTDLAINIAQVSSLLFPDLCSMYEHRDIYRSTED